MPRPSQAPSCRSRAGPQSEPASLALPLCTPGRASPHQRCTWLPGISGGAHRSTETRSLVPSARILREDSVFAEKPLVSALGESTGMAESDSRAEILGISSRLNLKAQVSKRWHHCEGLHSGWQHFSQLYDALRRSVTEELGRLSQIVHAQ